MKNLTTILCAFAMVLAIACTKEGKQGPKGDPGSPGTNGVNGTNGSPGTNGTNGTNGNANVIYSDWNNCTPTNTFSRDGYYFKRFTFLGDQNSTDSTSAILKYMRIKFTNGVITTGYQIPFEYQVMRYTSWYTGEFLARMNAAADDNAIAGYQVRTVLIKGSTHLRLSKPLNQMTYDEICELYSIPK
jgi:hypothetical protein